VLDRRGEEVRSVDRDIKARLLEAGLAAGRHRLSLRARGSGGRTGSAAVVIRILRVTPDLTITAPKSVSKAARRVRLRIASTVAAILRVGGRSFRVSHRPRAVAIAIKPGGKQLVLRLAIRGDGGRASYVVRAARR
jgi:hypothetical protein